MGFKVGDKVTWNNIHDSEGYVVTSVDRLYSPTLGNIDVMKLGEGNWYMQRDFVVVQHHIELHIPSWSNKESTLKAGSVLEVIDVDGISVKARIKNV